MENYLLLMLPFFLFIMFHFYDLVLKTGKRRVMFVEKNMLNKHDYWKIVSVRQQTIKAKATKNVDKMWNIHLFIWSLP